MAKPKTFEAPLKQDWPRTEYIESQNRLNDLLKKPKSAFVFCYNCRKDIRELVIHVVNFGKDVACRQCYTKKGWAKMRNRIGKFAIPPEIEEHFDDIDDMPDSKEFKEQVAQTQEDVDKVVDMCAEEISDTIAKMDNATFKP